MKRLINQLAKEENSQSESDEYSNECSELIEEKYFDTKEVYGPTPLVAVDWAGRMLELTLVPQGFAQQERVGDKAYGCSLELNIGVNYGFAANTQTVHNYRAIVFIWKDDAAPSITDIIEQDVAFLPSNYLASYAYDKKVKRHILFDKVITTAAYTDGTGDIVSMYNICENIKEKIDLCDLKDNIQNINYNNSVTTGTNKIYLLSISDLDPLDATAAWQVTIRTRYKYTDS